MSDVQPVPKHITATPGTFTVEDGWYRHAHAHRHEATGRKAFDGKPVNHISSSRHQHEHCWQPQERHHHPVEADPEQRGYACGFAQDIAFANARGSHPDRDPDPQEAS